jgi:hypothetical protein
MNAHPIKIRARLDPDIHSLAGECFWARPTDRPDEYEVWNLLCHAPFGLGDVVRVVDPGGLDLPQVVGVVSRTKRVTLRLDVLLIDDTEDELADAALGIAGSAVARICQGLGADVERLVPGVVVVRLPEGVGATGVEPSDEQEWLEWLKPVSPAALRQADPLLPDFLVVCDPVCGPHSGEDGLVTEFEEPPPFWDGWVPGFGSDQRFVQAYERADVPDWFTLETAAQAASDCYRFDDRVRTALDTGHPRFFDDLVTEAFTVVCLGSGLPVPPVDRVLWKYD